LARGGSPSQFSHAAPSNHPSTPTPVRRSSNLGPHGQRVGRGSGSDESPTAGRSSAFQTEETPRPNFKTIAITGAELKATGVHALLEENIPGLPEELQYELLTKLRVADALTSSLETRRQILAIRLLAVTNLAYIHLEAAFTEKVMKYDSDEPRRLQLVYQLAELVHPPAEGDTPVPLPLQTIAFSTLDALSQHSSKYNDVCSALNTNVSHGVLLYVVRKAVAGMAEDSASDKVTEQDEWRDALFSLLSDISMMPRAGGELITAGLMPILVEILGLRTTVAERYHQTVLSFLDNIMYSARDAFQTLVNADGLQAISDLIVYEVTNASENVAQGKGMRPEYRSAAVDYEIPYFQQQTLKWLFKFIHHMMTTAGGYGGNFDRLLRNLIDSSQLLGSLREIISNGQRFGSVVWTNAVGILNDFINNEPTSFAVIAEAGLSRALLEAVTCSTITMPADSKNPGSQAEQPASEPTHDRPPTAGHTDDDEDDDDDDEDDSDDEFRPEARRPTKSMLQTPREGPVAKGIMPTSESINIIPQAFGAICLNTSGMRMFLASRALESFFEIFESPEHVKCMDANKDLPSNLGGSFDELVRHHPPLKTAIINAILDMVARVSHLCKTKAEKNKLGAVLWVYDATGKPIVAGPEIKASYSSKGKGKAVDDGGDVEMEDAEVATTDVAASEPDNSSDASSMIPYVATVATFLSTIFSNTTVRSEFCMGGGIEYVLDLADSPCLAYDFTDGSASRILHGVIALLAEQKPHRTMPSLLQRAQSAADVLAPFSNYQGARPFFKPFVDREAQQTADVDLLAKGTDFAKALVNVHSLALTLHACLHPTSYTHRSAVNSLTQLNLGDCYAQLVKTLGHLLGACFREEYSLDKAVPYSFESAVRAKNSSLSDSLFAGLLGEPEVPSPAPEPSDADPRPPSQPNGSSTTPVAAGSPALGVSKPKPITNAERETPEFKNFKNLRYLLRKMPRTISPLFQILGKGLVPKRSGTDAFQKQSHAGIADALAETILNELGPREQESSMENIGHCIGMLHVLKDMLTDGKETRPCKRTCTNSFQFHAIVTVRFR
jgi:E3 ubiquitin-protein ligase HUWE1